MSCVDLTIRLFLDSESSSLSEMNERTFRCIQRSSRGPLCGKPLLPRTDTGPSVASTAPHSSAARLNCHGSLSKHANGFPGENKPIVTSAALKHASSVRSFCNHFFIIVGRIFHAFCFDRAAAICDRNVRENCSPQQSNIFKEAHHGRCIGIAISDSGPQSQPSRTERLSH